MIDSNGYRANVGIILSNGNNQVFWGKRVKQNAWQFPQGGLLANESIEDCLYRELWEEIGLNATDIKLVGSTRNWLRYKIPKRMIRDSKPLCIGQKQRWYLLKIKNNAAQFNFANTDKPEFDNWKWVSFWYPLREVIAFKREVYRRALKELAPLFFDTSIKGGRTKPLNNILE